MQGGVWKSRSLAATQRRCAATPFLPPPSTGNVTSDFRGQAWSYTTRSRASFSNRNSFLLRLRNGLVTKWKIKLSDGGVLPTIAMLMRVQRISVGFRLLIFVEEKCFEIIYEPTDGNFET